MDTPQDLFILTQALIDAINKAINKSRPKFKNLDEWASPEIWKNNVIKNLNNILSNPQEDLPKMLIGLSKNLDYYSLDWAHEEDKSKIVYLTTKIVIKSSKLLSVTSNQNIIKPCGQHEDDACVSQPLSPRQNFKTIHYSPPQLPVADAVNFCIGPQQFKANHILLMRIIGSINNPYGSYWFIGNLPHTKKDWRSRFAVMEIWNKGTHYVTLKFSNSGWFGYSSSQMVLSQKCILTGGGNQVWIPQDSIRKISADISPLQLIYW